MHHDLREGETPLFLSLVEYLRSTDVAFTNFEGAVSPQAGDLPPGRRPSDPATLYTLRWMGFNLLSLANNHAFEAGEKGILHTKRIAQSIGFAAAGTGSTLAEATGAGCLEVSGTRIAIIAINTANFQTKDAVAGLNGNPGVNPLRGEWADGGVRLCLDDVSRNLQTIEAAAQNADYVFVSLHEHLWPKDWTQTLQWKRDFTRQCLDAGATAVLCHGIPRACAIEVHTGKPIFHSMGNFTFHSRKSWGERAKDIWEGYIATADLNKAKVEELRILPIILAGIDGREDIPWESGLYPTFAVGSVRDRIIDRVIADSSSLAGGIDDSQERNKGHANSGGDDPR